MKINGVEGLSSEQVRSEVQQGAKFVIYQYCFSIVIMTFKRSSDIYYIRPGENAVMKGLPFTFLSLFLGWWGFPWGLIYTPIALFTNLGGGKDVTADILRAMAPPVIVPGGRPASLGDFDIPQNPW